MPGAPARLSGYVGRGTAGPRGRVVTVARAAVAGCVLVVVGAVAACGASASSGASSSAGPSAGASSGGSPAGSLATSFDTAGNDWAVVPMSSDLAFWEVFVRAAGSSAWRLVTPPGVADTGGLVAAAGGVNSLTVAVRPSQDLLFSPVADTADSGRTWSTGGPIGATVAASPDALSAAGRRLVALLGNGTIETSSTAGTTWSTLATPGAIAASAAGRGCGGTVRVTSLSFGPAGADVLAGGTCGAAGTGALFSYSPSQDWQRVSLPVAGPLVRLTGAMALVLSRSGLSALWAAQPRANGRPGAVSWSAPGTALPISGFISATGSLAGRAPAGAPGAWVLLSGGRAATIAAPAPAGGAAPRWLLLPPVPSHTAVLASGPDGDTDALAVSGATLTVWQLPPLARRWSKVQTIGVPIQYGSSS
ncbi:MAG TPA: hypothetical protein VIZ43_18600 [Trebonia sp.]